jgi:hypothetical protein
VLVQPEIEGGRSPLVSIPPLANSLYPSSARWKVLEFGPVEVALPGGQIHFFSSAGQFVNKRYAGSGRRGQARYADQPTT